MGSKVLDKLINESTFGFGLISDMSKVYVKQPDYYNEVNCIHTSNVARYWLKKEFDINKAVISICIVGDDNTPYVDVEVVRILNILVTDIVGAYTGKYTQKLKYDSVGVTYEIIKKAFPYSGNDLTLENYVEFLNSVLDNFTTVATFGFTKLSKIARKSFKGLDTNNLEITKNMLNYIAKGVHSLNCNSMPTISLKETDSTEEREILRCVCLETKFTQVPLLSILEFKENYIELGSIIATQWVNFCVDIHKAEEALLTTREAVFYTSYILVDMFISFRNGVTKIK